MPSETDQPAPLSLTPLETATHIEPNAIRVLLTGFGVRSPPISSRNDVAHTRFQPFFRYPENPSWLAVRTLHNKAFIVQPSLERPPPTTTPATTTAPAATTTPVALPALPAPQEPEPMAVSEPEVPLEPRQVHITAVQIPMTYEAVLSIVPDLHACPPILPHMDDPTIVPVPPPPNGYDFIFHVGVAGRGNLRLERLGHKLNYRMTDSEGQYAPAVQPPKESADSEAERLENERILLGLLGRSLTPAIYGEMGVTNPNQVVEVQPTRGFGKNYETFADELYTDVDVPRLIRHLKTIGIEYIYPSMDAGHYLCDFIYYCSLAEAKRGSEQTEGSDDETLPAAPTTPILSMHCPPVDQPLSTQAMSDAIYRITEWVCANYV